MNRILKSVEPAIVVDIDGTLTTDPLMIPEELKHTREGKDTFYKQVDYYDRTKCKRISAIPQIMSCLNRLISTGVKPFFITAREDEPKVRANTLEFLRTWLNGIQEEQLLMRPYNDFKNNCEVKEELLNTYVAPYYNILFALEDEYHNKEMFKKNGLLVLGVEQCQN